MKSRLSLHPRACPCRPLLAGAFVCLLPVLALAADTPPSTSDEAVKLDAFVVTGSNIRMSAAEADKTDLPVEFIPEAKFKLTSGESIADTLRNQPTIVGNVTSQFNDESAGGSSNVNLRGIGARYTLVVVDGRRVGGEGQPDIGAIPGEAIQSIEILKSGASAIFGTDAVAGVVNIKLKDRFEGFEVVSSYGNTTERDASYERVAAVFGVGTGKLRVVGSLAWENRNAIDKWDRGISASRDYRYLGGLDRRTTTRGLLNRIVVPGKGTLTLDTSKVGPGQTGKTAADYRAFNNNLDAYNNNELGTAPGFERYAGHWNVSYDLVDKRVVPFFQGFWDRHEQVFRPKEPRASISVPANNPYNPFGVAVTVDYQIDETKPVEESWDITQMQAIAGVRGEIEKFNYDIAYSRYSTTGHETWSGDYPTTLLTAAAARTNATAFNPFGYWANTPAQLAGLSVDKHYDQTTRTDILDAKVSGPVFALPAGDLRFAAGAEQRKIEFATLPDYASQTLRSAIFNDVRTASAGARKATAYFGELRAPLYRGTGSGLLSSADIGGAVRHEKFDDLSTAPTVGQASFKVGALGDALILRGSWAEAFKAPTVANLFANQVTNTLSGLFDPVRGAVGTANVTTGGNPGLKPENANTYNFGVIYSPAFAKGLIAKVDYWQINVTDIIFTPNAQAILSGTSPGGRVTSRDPVTQVPNIDARLSNGGDLNAAGLDVGLSYPWRTPLGRVTFDLSATYMTKFENVSPSGKFDFLGDYSNTYGPVPRLRAVLGTFWENRGWDSSLFLRYTDHLRESGLPAPLAPTRVTEDLWTADLQLGYNFKDHPGFYGMLKNLRIYVGVENLWDEPVAFLASSTDGWDRSLGDFRGRYVYAGIRKKF